MKKILSIFLVFFLCSMACWAQEERDQGPAEVLEPNKPFYSIKLSSLAKCGKKSKRAPIECELTLIHAKHTKKLILIKLNKKNQKGKGQVTIKKFLKEPDKYMSYATEYSLSALFNGSDDFNSLMARLATHEDRKKIYLKAQGPSGSHEAYIDIHEYTD